MWASDDAASLVDPNNGGEDCTRDGPSNVHHFLQSPSLLGIEVAEPGCDVIGQGALYCTPVAVQENTRRHKILNLLRK